MVDPARRSVEGEVVATVVGRLVELPPDRHAAQVAQQQRSDPAVCDDSDVTDRARRDGEHSLDGPDYPALRLNGALPAADALFWAGEERVGDRFEFRARQIA